MIPCMSACVVCVCCPLGSDALEGKGPQRGLQKRLGRRLEEVANTGGDYCRLQMPLRLALGDTGTVAGRRLGALEGGGGRIGTLGSQSCWQTGSAWGPTWAFNHEVLVHGSLLMCLRAATMCANPWVSLLYG